MQHLETKINECAQQVMMRLCGALAAAAQQAFQGQLGTTLQQQAVLLDLQAVLQGLAQQRAERWVPWAMHASAAGLASLLTLQVIWLWR